MKISKMLLTIMVVFLVIAGASSNQIYSSDDLEVLVRDGVTETHFQTTDPVMIPTTYTEKSEEFRGVWVATVWNLNMPQHTSETQYKTAFVELIDEVLAANMNAILFQVRPQNDAFYDSEYAPWSKWLTGTEGQDPGWDVMQYMIDYSHAHGIEFHAWLNPYRVTNSSSDKTTMLDTLHAENWAKINPDMVVAGNMDSHGRHPYILNPGEPAVKTYIRNVVTELITLYDVDGIHFDDYFYPYSGISSDTTTYDTYKETGQAIEDWRRENVNDVVRGVKEDFDTYNSINSEDIRFGISPFGLWASGVDGYSKSMPDGSNTGPTNMSSYHDQFADSKRWVEEGWVHYICPQVYFEFTHNTAPYADLVDWWASVVRGTEVDLIIGQAISSAELNNWDADEIATQLRYNQKHPEIKGTVMYSGSYLDKEAMALVNTSYWTTIPTTTWSTSSVISPSVSLNGTLDGDEYRTDVTVTLSSTNTIYYKIDSGDWTLYTAPLTFTSNGNRALYFKAINGGGEESMISSININIVKINSDIPTISIVGDMIGTKYVVDSKIVLTSATEDMYVAINHGSVGEWELYTGEITLSDLGLYYIRTKTIDINGTESAETTLAVEIVNSCYEDPVITIIGNEISGVYPSATVSVATDSPTVYYKINDGSWLEYTGILSLTEDGSFTVSFKNDDACATIISETIVIDALAPDIPSITTSGNLNGDTYEGVTTFTLSSDDPDATIKYRLHNGVAWSNWFYYNDEIILAYTALFTVEYIAIDEVGNRSDSGTTYINVDVPDSENNIYIVRDKVIVTYYGTTIPIILPETYTEKTEEIRAVWIATVNHIDIPIYTNQTDYQASLIRMLDRIEENNFNTIFFQVRPSNDAFYDSDYAPWSRFLTGLEGKDPGWDVFGFLLEEAHKRGIEVHAWLNPYRATSVSGSKTEQLDLLDDKNYAKIHPELVIVDDAGKLLLNPGEPQVQAYIKNVIQELIYKYDIDGIHFDDYFYSYAGMQDIEDEAAYNMYKEDGQSLDDWRRENVDTIIEDIFNIIEQYNQTKDANIKFGISPFGIWKSGGEDGANASIYAMQSYKDQYADTKKWVEEGWLHYILPQIYWEFDHNAAPFADQVDWWVALCEEADVDLIIGHALYRYIDGGFNDTDELIEQLRYISQFDIIIGSSFFSYKSMLSQDPEILDNLNRLNDIYWTEYVTFPWESDVEKEIPVDPICRVDQVLENGECVDIPLVCGFNQTEIDGECVDNPIICLDGYEELDGKCVLIDEPPVEKKTGCFSQVYISSLFVYTTAALGGGLFFFLKRKK